MKGVLQRALTVGALWAFVEVVFTYAIGKAPTSDALETFAAPVLASVVWHLFFSSVGTVRPHRAFDALTNAGLLVPALWFLIRNQGQFTPTSLLAALAPVALCAAWIFREWKTPDGRGWLTPWRVFSILSAYLASALVFVIRTDRLAAITSPLVLSASLWCLGMAVVLAMAMALLRRFAFASLLVIVCSGSFLVAARLGSAPPRYPREAGDTSAPASGSERRPNVLLIVLDTVRVDHLDLYGYARPTFSQTSRYLRDGLIFDRATSSGTFSLPSHGSLFTGLLPSAHGGHTVIGGDVGYARIWPEIPTMASWLHDRGYRTAGVSGNDIFLAAWTGLQKGFDVFSSSGIRSQRFVPMGAQFRRLLSRIGFLKRRSNSNSWSGAQITDAAIDLVSQPREPFFLFLNYFDAHEPHVAMGSPPWFGAGPMKPIDAYDSEIASIDSQIARLLSVLQEKGQLDRTLLIVAADHGEYFDEWRLRGHPAASYEPSTHVPLVLRLPHVVEAGKTERRTGLHEVFRMVQDVVDGKSLDWTREIDLSPRILNEGWARKEYGKIDASDGRPSTTVVFEGNLKLIHRVSGRSELFDLDNDPGEQQNLFGSEDPKLVSARERMVKQVMLRTTRRGGPAQPLTEDALERLRALGYLR